MKLRLFIAALFVFLVMPVSADIVIEDSFVRAAIKQQRNSAAFMSITNQSASDLAVVKAQSPVADIVELHTHTNDNGVMRMRQISQIDLPAGQQVVLQPGGLHVMLLGLTQDLKVGDQIDITLILSDMSEKKIVVPVKQMMMRKKMMQHSNM